MVFQVKKPEVSFVRREAEFKSRGAAKLESRSRYLIVNKISVPEYGTPCIAGRLTVAETVARVAVVRALSVSAYRAIYKDS